MLLFIFHKMRQPKKFLQQRNTTKGVPLENKMLTVNEIKMKAIFLFYNKLTYSEN